MDLRQLETLLSIPTAPFREQLVLDFFKRELSKLKIPFFSDPIGNLVIGFGSAKEYQAALNKPSKDPMRVFLAHTDHPGFHGVKWVGPSELEVKWFGGTPNRHLNGSKLWVSNARGQIHHGTLTHAKLHPSGRWIVKSRVKFNTQLNLKSIYPKANELFGAFSFRAPVWRKGDRLYTKAADDLIGCFAILELAKKLFKTKKPTQFVGILTRAEEVGFVGAIGHFELKWLSKAKRPVVCISLETSRTLPGAVFGKGPIVRLGDRAGVFTAPYVSVLHEAAKQVIPKDYQRRIMDGGTCEATAALAYGLPAIGISIPLGNYHNQSFEGGPDSRGPLGPAPEFVDLSDLKHMITLCDALVTGTLPWRTPWLKTRQAFSKRLRESRKLLVYRS